MIGTFLAATTLAATAPAAMAPEAMAPGATAPANAREAYGRRTFLLEADAKCHLLSERERIALSGSAQQARGALLRAGLRPASIHRDASSLAASISCTDEQLRDETATARAAFSIWAAQQKQDFAGERQGWSASRAGAPDMMAWTLWQDIGDGFRLGVTEDAERRALVVALPAGGARPRTVALEFRDAKKWADFVDPTLGGLFAAAGGDGLAARAAPEALCKRVWTAGRIEGAVQAPIAGGAFLNWELPGGALEEMATLDPRDVARLTVEYPDNETRTLYVEIGDLAAALGFLAAGDTPSTRPRAAAPAGAGGHHQES